VLSQERQSTGEKCSGTRNKSNTRRTSIISAQAAADRTSSKLFQLLLSTFLDALATKRRFLGKLKLSSRRFRNQGRILISDISKRFFHELQFCPMLRHVPVGMYPGLEADRLIRTIHRSV
jgi:hypothetical protein